MCEIEMGIDPLIQRIIGVYYALGIWQRETGPKNRNFFRTFVFFFCTISYPCALTGGGLVSDDLGDSVFLFTLGIVVAVLEFKGFYIFFKQDEIVTLLNATCTRTVPNNDHLLHSVNKTLNIFKKCVVIFIVLSVGLTLIIVILSSPLISHKLPFDIWFPLDYKGSLTAHWIAHCFVLINELFVILVSLLSSITWYVMLNCSIQYEILGYRFKNCGAAVGVNSQTIAGAKKHDLFESDLIKCIQMHRTVEKNVKYVGSFFSTLFFIQIGTSAFCICGSVYILAVDSSSQNLFFVCIGLLYYATLDIFFLMYLGNEIKDSSSKLVYCLFESNWMDQTESSKGSVTVVGEGLKRHQVIMVAKLYSLSLETFNAIIRGTYSMFNVLNSM